MDFSYDPESSGKELSIHQRKAIYLISKEAINNAIKYSDCKNINCNFDLNASPQQVLIRDDGNGFCIKKNMDGNGLKNMEARAEEINATIKITSVPGNGTTIELEL